jgi:hypothetical protein
MAGLTMSPIILCYQSNLLAPEILDHFCSYSFLLFTCNDSCNLLIPKILFAFYNIVRSVEENEMAMIKVGNLLVTN